MAYAIVIIVYLNKIQEYKSERIKLNEKNNFVLLCSYCGVIVNYVNWSYFSV